MSAALGLVGFDGPERVADALGDRHLLVPVEATPGAVAGAQVDAWIVLTPDLPPPVLQTVRDGARPALFLVEPSDALAWHRVLRKGLHDVQWLPLVAGELRARVGGLLARREAWNHVSGALCREIAHDLRGPLQALHFTVAALQNDAAVLPGFEEDVDALLEATDVADLMLNGVSNMGRDGQPVPAEGPPVDLLELVRRTAARRAFGGAVVVGGGEPLPVRADPQALSSAIEDVVRVAWSRSAGRRGAEVQCLRFSGQVVLTVRARAYAALLEHLPALLWRERPILLRRERIPMPLSGLAYAREVAVAAGGDLTVVRDGEMLQIEVRLPLA